MWEKSYEDGRRKGRLKRGWMDSEDVDLREKGLSGEEKERTTEAWT